MGFGIVVDSIVKDPESGFTFLPDKEINGDANSDFVVKDIPALLTPTLATGAGVTLQVNGPQLIKLIGYDLAKAVVLPCIQECAVADEGDDAIVVEAIGGPA